MSFDDEKILQDYLARLLQLQDERDEWLDADDLRAAARDLGLSEEDLARVEASVAAHRQRGQRFAEHGAWDDALAEYRQATALAPFDNALLYETAQAHAERYRQHADPADRAAAERYARRSIQLDPDHTPSYELLTALRAEPDAVPAAQRPLAPMLIGGLLLGLVAALAFVLIFALDAGPPTAPPPPPPPVVGQAPPGTGQQVLPVTLAGEANGLILDVQRSVLRSFDSTFSYTLHAGVRIEKQELHQLRLRLDLLDAEGGVVLSEEFDALGETEPYLRPGDTAPVDHLVFERRPPPAVQAARLTVGIIEQQAAPGDYGPADPVAPTWTVEKPAFLDLEITERENRVTDVLGTRRMHFLALAVRNTGRRAFHRLRLKATWYGATGEVLTTKERYVVTTAMPALRPGETYVTRLIGEFPPGDGAPFARYGLEITSAD